GWWLGEDNLYVPALAARLAFGVPNLSAGAVYVIVAVFPTVLIGLLIAFLTSVWARDRFQRHRVITYVTPVAACLGAFILASTATTHAFNQCVERGESIRSALEQYRSAHSVYPQTLSVLSGVTIPGKR